MSPNANTSNANNVWRVFGDGNAGNNNASYANAVFPAIYLKTDILIKSGNGTSSDPYILNAGS